MWVTGFKGTVAGTALVATLYMLGRNHVNQFLFLFYVEPIDTELSLFQSLDYSFFILLDVVNNLRAIRELFPIIFSFVVSTSSLYASFYVYVLVFERHSGLTDGFSNFFRSLYRWDTVIGFVFVTVAILAFLNTYITSYQWARNRLCDAPLTSKIIPSEKMIKYIELVTANQDNNSPYDNFLAWSKHEKARPNEMQEYDLNLIRDVYHLNRMDDVDQLVVYSDNDNVYIVVRNSVAAVKDCAELKGKYALPPFKFYIVKHEYVLGLGFVMSDASKGK